MTGPKQTMFLLHRQKTLSKDAHPPGTTPAQLNLPSEAQWVFVLAETSAHSVLASVSFVFACVAV